MNFTWTFLKVSIENPISLLIFLAKIQISALESLFVGLLEGGIHRYVRPISSAIAPPQEQ